MLAAHPRIAILMATFDGGRFLRAQLDSLVGQTVTGWRLVVSDDGSRDDTRAIVAAFAAANPGREVALIEGPRQGATRNFLHLAGQVRAGEWLAWCDQDDVWLPDRLARGVAALTAEGPPALHACRTILCAEDLTPLGPAPLYARPASFRNALVQACTPGNTTLVNPAGAALLASAAQAAAQAGVVSHDWFTYQLIAGAGGAVIRDPAQTVLYRQPPRNVMGRNDTLRARLARAALLGGGDYGSWLAANTAALRAVADRLTATNRQVLRDFGKALGSPGPVAAARLARLGVYRQTRTGTAALLAAAAAGRLRQRTGR